MHINKQPSAITERSFYSNDFTGPILKSDDVRKIPLNSPNQKSTKDQEFAKLVATPPTFMTIGGDYENLDFSENVKN